MLLNIHHGLDLSLNFLSSNHLDYFSNLDLISKTIILAQSQADIDKIDIIQDIVNAWQNFVQTGQSWAMLIGIFLGYAFRSFLP